MVLALDYDESHIPGYREDACLSRPSPSGYFMAKGPYIRVFIAILEEWNLGRTPVLTFFSSQVFFASYHCHLEFFKNPSPTHQPYFKHQQCIILSNASTPWLCVLSREISSRETGYP